MDSLFFMGAPKLVGVRWKEPLRRQGVEQSLKKFKDQ